MVTRPATEPRFATRTRTPVMLARSMLSVFGSLHLVVAHEDGGAAARDRIDDEAAVGLRDASSKPAPPVPSDTVAPTIGSRPSVTTPLEARRGAQAQHDLAASACPASTLMSIGFARRQPFGEGGDALPSGGQPADGELALRVGHGGARRGEALEHAVDRRDAHAGAGDRRVGVGAHDAADDGGLGRERVVALHAPPACTRRDRRWRRSRGAETVTMSWRGVRQIE